MARKGSEEFEQQPRVVALRKKYDALERRSNEIYSEKRSVEDLIEKEKQAFAGRKAKENGFLVGRAFVAYPKHHGDTLNIVVRSVTASYDGTVILVSAVIGRGGKVKNIREINTLAYDLTPVNAKELLAEK